MKSPTTVKWRTATRVEVAEFFASGADTGGHPYGGPWEVLPTRNGRRFRPAPYGSLELPTPCQTKGTSPMQTIEKIETQEEREGFEPSPSTPPNPATDGHLAPASDPCSVPIANALPAPRSALGAASRDMVCACGAMRGDHLAATPISGYCILRKNTRTSKLPGVLAITAVKL